MPIQLKLKNNMGTIKMIGKPIVAPSADLAESSFFINIPKSNLKESSVKVELDVISNGKVIDNVKTGRYPFGITLSPDEGGLYRGKTAALLVRLP